MARKATIVVTPEQQVANVQRALDRLRRCQRFRGQEELIHDAARQLAILIEEHRHGRLPPVLLD